ncbi:MAG: RIP metalloprotease RseP [Clostridia bacterium]|nr:RIP metalloprotease RseP [Clostridia bacterium]
MNILYILGAILLFGIIIAVHELGHFLAARATGIPVMEFSIGMGPRIVGGKRGDTEYSLRAIPLGGYCRFVGEDEESDDPRAMNNQKVWKRIITVFAGPFMNFVLGYLVIVVFLSCIGSNYTVPKIQTVAAESSALDAGLEPGDIIEKINGTEISYDTEGAMALIQGVRGTEGSESVTLTVLRGGSREEITLTPQLVGGTAQIGVGLGYETFRVPFFTAVREGFPVTAGYLRMMLDAIRQLFATGEGLEDTMGPVGIIQFATEEIKEGGFEQALNLLLLLTLNIGLMNLLPLPALDGGRLIFLFLEAIRRKPVPPKYEGWVHAAGFVLLIGVFLLVTGHDLIRLFTGRGFGG